MVTGFTTAAQQSFTASNRNTSVGRDYIINVGTPSGEGGNTRNVRAVTTSVEAFPLDENLWTVKVHNGSKSPISDLGVNVYVADQFGRPTDSQCIPAKGRMSIEQLTRDLMGQAIRGGLGAVEDQARMAPLASLLMPKGTNLMGFVDNSTMIPDILNMAMPGLRQHMRAMNDTFPTVVPAGQSAAVVYFAEGQGQVQADIKFDDEAGNHWVRLFGQPPVLTE